ncbi:MAG: hypothetical protein ACYDEJ_04685 [Desulfitobacteriaceae bacterium]
MAGAVIKLIPLHGDVNNIRTQPYFGKEYIYQIVFLMNGLVFLIFLSLIICFPGGIFRKSVECYIRVIWGRGHCMDI